ncbi:uncharacterized protein NPIL_619401 [Nephila pilipes]|uniref:Uncharacterized protein n=1 Tax=Nephila pilipes TaxID=299642 RepID=A0A8X6T2G8_NEPPI|nr:uncharacterized protein NPIL_619401 [Nephila pilipes]
MLSLYWTEEKTQNKFSELFSDNHHHIVNSRALDTKGWSEWMPWDCSVSCGGGKGTRSRICFDPDVCKGPDEERGRCNTKPCPKMLVEENNRILEDIRNHLLTAYQNFQAHIRYFCINI